MEMWKPIPDWPWYEASNFGRVRGAKNRRGYYGDKTPNGWTVLKPSSHTRKRHGVGYKRVILRRDGKSYAHYVHRLVLLAFVGPPPEGTECCHKDDNGHNNRLTNLYWGDKYDQVRDRMQNGKMGGSRAWT